jgi:hypothetical protein
MISNYLKDYKKIEKNGISRLLSGRDDQSDGNPEKSINMRDTQLALYDFSVGIQEK